MASTILHFYNPDTFPIIDQRAYRELRSEEMPQNIKKEKVFDIYYERLTEMLYTPSLTLGERLQNGLKHSISGTPFFKRIF